MWNAKIKVTNVNIFQLEKAPNPKLKYKNVINYVFSTKKYICVLLRPNIIITTIIKQMTIHNVIVNGNFMFLSFYILLKTLDIQRRSS